MATVKNNSGDIDLTPYPDPDIDDCYRVPLANGGYALIDEDDVCRVDHYTWLKRTSPTNNTYYVVTYVYDKRPKGTAMLMHRHLFGLTKEDRIQVDHKNRDGLDNRRKANLRLATGLQNQANRTKFRIKCHSSYKGVSKHSSGRWTMSSFVRMPHKRVQYHIGFDSEAEAAFAYNVAAPLVMDPEFVFLNHIAETDALSPTRQVGIRNLVVSAIKAIMEGRKSYAWATSCYRGVAYIPSNLKWRASMRVDKTLHYFGLYETEGEAAFAYNVGASILLGSSAKLVEIKPTDIPEDQIKASIRAYVERREE